MKLSGMNSKFVITLCMAASLPTACKPSTTKIERSEPAVIVQAGISSSELESTLRAGTLEVNGQNYAQLYVERTDTANIRSLSNDLWNGNNSASRNRAASVRLAALSFEKAPQSWSALRSGIGYLNGTGVEKDLAKAIDRLSNIDLADNSAAAYFLALAYEQTGDVTKQKAALERAKALGHPKAAAALKALL